MNEKNIHPTQQQVREIHESWLSLRGFLHSKICKIGALDGFNQALGIPYAPQVGAFNFGTPEFDAYYLGQKLASEFLYCYLSTMQEELNS